MPLYSCKQFLSIPLHLRRSVFFSLCNLPGCRGLRPTFQASSYRSVITVVFQMNALAPERAGVQPAEPLKTLRAAAQQLSSLFPCTSAFNSGLTVVTGRLQWHIAVPFFGLTLHHHLAPRYLLALS